MNGVEGEGAVVGVGTGESVGEGEGEGVTAAESATVVGMTETLAAKTCPAILWGEKRETSTKI